MGWACHNLGKTIGKALDEYKRSNNLEEVIKSVKQAYGDEFFEKNFKKMSEKKLLKQLKML